MNLGLAFKHNGDYVLGALANLLHANADGNILATPNLLTLDNQEAQILVGENRPFVTGSYATSSNTSTANPFTTVERKDVGLTLRVRPQINANGTVKLTIYQETSNIIQDTAKDNNGPSTTKRSIESTVLVDDGSAEAPVVTRTVYPTYRGALVVCQGGGDAQVRLAVTAGVAALTGLGSDRITVVKCQ